MRRIALRALLLVAALGFPGAALADVTAHYMLNGKDALTVEVDDGGNARLGIEGKFSLILRDGVDYAAITIKGRVLVVRYTDLIALAKVKLKAEPVASMRDEDVIFTLASGAAVEVAGRKGTAWTLVGKDKAPGTQRLELVMSDDPEIAPIGALIRRMAEPVVPILQGMLPESTGFGVQVLALLAKGTPLRVPPFLELMSVDRKEIDPHRFDLPGPVLSAEEFDKAGDAASANPSAVPLLPLP